MENSSSNRRTSYILLDSINVNGCVCLCVCVCRAWLGLNFGETIRWKRVVARGGGIRTSHALISPYLLQMQISFYSAVPHQKYELNDNCIHYSYLRRSATGGAGPPLAHPPNTLNISNDMRVSMKSRNSRATIASIVNCKLN